MTISEEEKEKRRSIARSRAKEEREKKKKAIKKTKKTMGPGGVKKTRAGKSAHVEEVEKIVKAMVMTDAHVKELSVISAGTAEPAEGKC